MNKKVIFLYMLASSLMVYKTYTIDPQNTTDLQRPLKHRWLDKPSRRILNIISLKKAHAISATQPANPQRVASEGSLPSTQERSLPSFAYEESVSQSSSISQ